VRKETKGDVSKFLFGVKKSKIFLFPFLLGFKFIKIFKKNLNKIFNFNILPKISFNNIILFLIEKEHINFEPSKQIFLLEFRE